MAALSLVGLVGDIGGTNARFAIARVADGVLALEDVQALPGIDYATLELAARAYLDRIDRGRLDAAVVACAGAVVNGAVTFTNHNWSVTETSLGAALGLPRAYLLNDLAAVAWAAAGLPQSSLRPIARAPACPGAGHETLAILNAGTGTNASAFVPSQTGGTVVVGEYGHVSFAPVDALELEIWRYLQAAYGRVSLERVLCGPGFLNIYRALAAIEGKPATCATPAAVSQAAAAGDVLAQAALGRFCAMMGSAAGDVVLAYGARGGVLLAGGVAATLMQPPHDALFRQRFDDKGRFRSYMEAIPCWVIEDTNTALLGAARAMLARAAP